MLIQEYPLLIDILLDYDAFIKPLIASIVINIIVYFSVSTTLAHLFKTSRQSSWLLTLLSSSVLVFGAFPFFVEFISLSPTQTVNDLPSLNSLWARTLCIFFMGYLIADLFVGIFFYLKQINLVTGWIHHFGYLLCMINMLKYEIPAGFLCFASILEIPTISLALGHIHPPLRSDMFFGASFFISRIVLHSYVIWHVYQTFESNFWMVTATPFPIHVFWFSRWASKRLFSAGKVKQI